MSDVFLAARFWSKVDVQGADKCWLFKGSLSSFGHGQFKLGETCVTAHRVAYELIKGAVPEGAVIRHQCDNPACCNPLHLEAGTHADNVLDRVIRDRSAKGPRNGRSKLSEHDVHSIRASSLSITELAAQYGVDRKNIRDIIKGKTWRYLSEESL